MESTTQTTTRSILTALAHFIGKAQCWALASAMRGEEKQFFFGKLKEYADRIETMPKTYETDGQGDAAIVQLHYFTGSADWFIVEKDSEPEQLQSFGLADLFQDGGELGYINIEELTAAGAELDLYWKPATLKDVRAKRDRS